MEKYFRFKKKSFKNWNVHLPQSIKSVFQSWSNPILATVFWTLPIEVTMTEPKELPMNVVHMQMEIQVGSTLSKIEIGPINMKDMIKLMLLKTERIPGFDIRSQSWKLKIFLLTSTKIEKIWENPENSTKLKIGQNQYNQN